MDILKTPQNLVKEKLNMLLRKWLVTFNNLREIGFHQFVYNINLLKLFTIWRLENSFDIDDVIMI